MENHNNKYDTYNQTMSRTIYKQVTAKSTGIFVIIYKK